MICNEATYALAACQARARSDLKPLGISSDSIESMLSVAKENLLANILHCESPIEQVMLTALSHMVVPKMDCFPPAIHVARGRDQWPMRPVVICPQFAIARFRLDFLVVIDRRWIAVECDGQEFHDEVKHRVRDIQRDDYLEAMGIATIRYWGRWIVKNSHKVADEIAAIIEEG